MELLYDPNAMYADMTRPPGPLKPCEFNAFASLCATIQLMSEFSVFYAVIQGFYIPQRYWLTFMGFLGLVMAYSMRLSLSVAITQMVPPPIVNASNLIKANGEMETICPYTDQNYYNEHFDPHYIFDSLYSSVGIKLVDVEISVSIHKVNDVRSTYFLL